MKVLITSNYGLSTRAPFAALFRASRPYQVIVLTLLLGLAAALGWFRVIHRWEERSLAANVRDLAAGQTELLRGNLLGSIEVLNSAAAFCASRGKQVTRREFHDFVTAALARHPEIQALSWNPLVPAAERAERETASGGEGLHPFAFWEMNARGEPRPVAPRAAYLPVYLEEPVAGNERSLGFDLASDPRRRASLDRARDSGLPESTEPLRLVQETAGQFGFLILQPIYGGPDHTVANRRTNLAGFVSAVFRIGHLVEVSLGKSVSRDVEVAIRDDWASQTPIYSSGNPPPTNAAARLSDGDRWTSSQTLEFPGGRWRLYFRPTPRYLAAHGSFWQSRAGSAAGLVITLLACGYLRRGKRHAVELAQANAALRLEVVERRRAEGKADAANQAKSDFLAHMSHEIRTPLNAILGYAQILRRDPALAAVHRPAVETIASGGNHLLALINDVLDLSKIEAGHMELRSEPFSPRHLLERIETMFAQQCRRKGVAWRVTAPTDLPEYVHGDERKLRQVLINLVGNAVKFTDAGEIHLRVTLGPTRDARCRFEVGDTGTGIPPEARAAIFEPFRQGVGGDRRKGGTGLGLPIARRQVELMGGHLELMPDDRVGSRFCFEIPLHQGASDPVAPSSAEPPPELAAVLSRSPGLLARLQAAAELYSLTELQSCVVEIENLGETGCWLARRLGGWLAACDLQAVEQFVASNLPGSARVREPEVANAP